MKNYKQLKVSKCKNCSKRIVLVQVSTFEQWWIHRRAGLKVVLGEMRQCGLMAEPIVDDVK